ncbi:hypothetical protein Tco_1394857 [Tanacetum coccineum]
MNPRNNGEDRPDQAKDASGTGSTKELTLIEAESRWKFEVGDNSYMLKVSPWEKDYLLSNAPELIILPRPNLGVLQIGIKAKVIENQILSCLLYPQSPTHPSTLILSQGVFWGADEERSDGGPEHPQSPNYVPGLEHPPLPVEVPYVPEPEYTEYLVPFDAEAPLEDQHLPVDALPTTLSPGYVVDSDPDEDPEEDPEEDHADYPGDGRDGDDEPSDADDDDDDTNDEDEDPIKDEDDDEEEEHLALVDSSAILVVDHVPSAGDTEAFENDEAAPTPVPLPRWHTDRMSVRPQTPILLPSEAEIPLPPLPASLSILPPVDRREDTPKAELPPRKRLCLTTPTLKNEVGESSTATPKPTRGHRADYGFISTMDAKIRRQRAEEVSYGIRDVWVDPTEAVEEEALVSREAWAHSVGLSLAVHYELQVYRTHTRMQDYRITSQESLMTTLIAQVSSLQGQLSTALGHIQALQARDQTHADDREGTASTTIGLVFSFLVSDNHNNMPPRRTSATARVVVAAAAAAVEQLIKATVSATLANHETLRNSTNGQGNGSHNSDTGI